MMDISFAHPRFLFLLVLIPFLVTYYIYSNKRNHASFKVPTLSGIGKVGTGWRTKLLPVLPFLRILGFAALVVALARPQTSLSSKEISTEGIDIVLSLDVSSSMLAKDFLPDRLEASKEVAKKFIEGRPNDRIGLVVFAGESFTQCPITTDHNVLNNLFKNVKSGLIEDGTAIGMGLSTALSRLVESDAKSKVVILMTDGVNNAGYIDPLTAVEIAKSEGIRVYTIGVGTKGLAPYPMKDYFGRTVYQNEEVQIDEELLKKIAAATGGEYFRATNNDKLEDIYKNIDKLEKSKVNVSSYERKSEKFFLFAFIALAALALEALLRNTLLRKLI